jgi:hypothetical protein
MAKQVTSGISVSGADKTEKILGIGLVIALVGFFLILIFQGFDNLFTDILDDIGNFPGLKQLLALLGSVAQVFTSLIGWITGKASSGSSGS